MGFFIPAVIASIAGYFADREWNEGKVVDAIQGTGQELAGDAFNSAGRKLAEGAGVDTDSPALDFFKDNIGKIAAGGAGLWGLFKMPASFRNAVIAIAVVSSLILLTRQLESQNLQNDFVAARDNVSPEQTVSLDPRHQSAVDEVLVSKNDYVVKNANGDPVHFTTEPEIDLP